MAECSMCKRSVPKDDTRCVRCGDLEACFQSLVNDNPTAAHDWLRGRVEFLHNYRGSVENIDLKVSLVIPGD